MKKFLILHDKKAIGGVYEKHLGKVLTDLTSKALGVEPESTVTQALEFVADEARALGEGGDKTFNIEHEGKTASFRIIANMTNPE